MGCANLSHTTLSADKKRALIFCDYHPGLLEALSRTFEQAGLTTRVLIRKLDKAKWRDANSLVIDLPLRVIGEEEPLRLASFLSALAYLIVAGVLGVFFVLKGRVKLVLAVFAFPQGLVALVVGRLTRRKVVILTDGGDIDIFLKRPLIRTIMLGCLRAADVVTALNKTKSSALSHYGINSELCATIGVDVNQFKYVPFGDKDKWVLLCVARLVPEKRLDVFLKACEILHKEGMDFSVLLVGDGRLRSEIASQVGRMGMAKVVSLKGYVRHSEIQELFARTPIFVLPSIREGVSVSLLEAMSSGCVCIVSDIADNLEIVHDMETGITFHADDETNLTDKLRWAMLHPSELANMTTSARDRVERDFSFEVIAVKLGSILSRL